MENGTNSGSGGGGGGGGSGERQSHRLLLSDVVSDCLRRWFQDTLKEAKAGDLSMQVLVAQMYFNGYGIPKDHQKARIWMTRAARVRSSVWRVSSKRQVIMQVILIQKICWMTLDRMRRRAPGFGFVYLINHL